MGMVPVKKGDFFPLFWAAWVKAFRKDIMLRAFRNTGISPLNPNIIIDRFRNKQRSRSASRESSVSHYSGDDWPKIHTLIRKSDARDVDAARKLERSVHHLTVQNELYKHEINGLVEAVERTKNHIKSAKTLPLETHEEYAGGAVFWSPKKVKEAKQRREQRNKEKHDMELHRANMKELQCSTKLYKEKLAEEKRRQREEARVAREAEKARKQAEKEAKQRARDAQKAMQLSQKGKRKASTAPSRNIRQKRARRERAHVVEVEEAHTKAPPRTSRRGRNINLPKRYI
ncbi:hypothetical protein DM02DRAFT_25493 [Periconia macrospinosa]|uniref:Uncharacterized protein n=1 Tax=Periconia macrospinosa TaxID=97972 RepID=A0A2V1DP29_9PLEO|nr:hypothetical protein DM02DRAFT_25493 [Periconia macrospinosa]